MISQTSTSTTTVSHAAFLTTVIDELRRPLQAWGLMQELLEMRATDEQSRTLIARSNRILGSISATINVAIDVHNLEAGTISPETVDVEVAPLLKRLQAEFARDFSLELPILRVETCDLSVRSDPMLLYHLLQAMIAAVMSSEIPNKVLLSCRRRGEVLRIEVLKHSTAPGPRDLSLCQTDNRNDEPGWVLARQIARRLDHSVHYSAMDSTFAIDLPLVCRDTAPSWSDPENCGEATKPAPSRHTFCVIDDDPVLRNAMGSFLMEHGWDVETYSSAEAYLEADSPGRKGYLLLDVIMPGMGGVELLHRLRERGDQFSAIVLTGHGDLATAVETMKAGAKDFIQKPVSSEGLLAAIDRILALDDNAYDDDGVVNLAVRLTSRQRQIMDMILLGHPNKRIAYELGISQRTVETHRANIMRKAGAKSLAGLIRLALVPDRASA